MIPLLRTTTRLFQPTGIKSAQIQPSIRYFHTNLNRNLRPTMSNFFYPSSGLGLGHNTITRSNPGPRLDAFVRHYTQYNRGPSTYQMNMYLIYGLIGANVGVYAYGKYCSIQAQQGTVKPLVDFYKNFTLNLNQVKDEGRWWTLLTCAFTHTGEFHLLGNMLSIYYIGEVLARTPGIGPGRFLTLAIGSALMGSAVHLYQRTERVQATGGFDNTRALGFSGAVMGVGAVTACFYPTTTFHIYGIIPAPLWVLIAGYGLYDGFYLNSQNSQVGHAGHIGGLAFGLLYYVARLRGVVRF